MRRLLELLAACLRPAMTSRKVILSLDAFRAHLTASVWRCAAAQGFFVFVVPAGLTWVLQPCDTHLFAPFKRRLGEIAQQLAAETPDGHLSQRSLVRAVVATVEEIILGRPWGHAFQDCGLVGSQPAVSQRVLAKLGCAPPACGSELPTLAMLQDVFPARMLIPIMDVFRPFVPARRLPLAPRFALVRERSRSPRRDPRAPWHGRLRSSSALSLRAPRTPPSALALGPSEPPPDPSASSTCPPPPVVPPAPTVPRLPRAVRLPPGPPLPPRPRRL
jgi:hypothetical protein